MHFAIFGPGSRDSSLRVVYSTIIVYANIYKLALILPGCAAALAIYNIYSHQIRIYVYTILWMFSDALQKSFRDERNISDKLKKGVSEYLKSAPKRLKRYVLF